MHPFIRTSDRTRRGPQLFAISALFFALAVCHASAVFAFTITDSEFNEGDWTSFVFSERGVGGSVVGSQSLSFGNPAPGYFVDLILNPNPIELAAVYAFHRYEGFTYDPAIEGALDSVSLGIDHININGGFSQGLRVGIEQNGVVFEHVDQILPNGVFRRLEISDRTPSDFFDRNGGTLLDFSASGAPLSFGFVTANSNSGGGGGFVNDVLYDNFLASSLPIPEPGTGVLMALGLLLLGATGARSKESVPGIRGGA